MAKKRDITEAMGTLEKAQKEIQTKRIDAIRKMDINADDRLREQMIVLDGFEKDIENIIYQLDEYIVKNNILAAPKQKRRPVRRSGRKSEAKKVQTNKSLGKKRTTRKAVRRKPAGNKPTPRKTAMKKVPPGVIGRRPKGIAKALPKAGTKIRATYKGKEYWGDVTGEGIVIQGINGVYATMSSAATAVTKTKNLNGWAFWKKIEMGI